MNIQLPDPRLPWQDRFRILFNTVWPSERSTRHGTAAKRCAPQSWRALYYAAWVFQFSPRIVLSPYRSVLGLSLPIAGVQLAGVVLTTTDVAMLSSVSVAAIAGGGLGMQLYNQIRTMCVGMVTASANLVAHADGHRHATGEVEATEWIRQVVRASFVLATAVGILGALVVIGLGALVLVLPIDAEVARLTFLTTVALAPGLMPMIWLNVLRQFTVGMRRPGSLLAITVVSIFINLGLDWLAITHAPTLAWSVVGIGAATTVTQALSLAGFALLVARDAQLRPYLDLRVRSRRQFREDASTLARMVRLGIPVSLNYGSEAAITTIAGLAMSAAGAQLLAAHNVVNQMAYVVYQVCIGFSHGGSVLVSRGLANGAHAVARVCQRVLVAASIYLGVVAVAWFTVGGVIVALFLPTADAPTLAIARILLMFAVAQQFAKGLQNVLVGLLRGLGDTAAALQGALIGYWAVGVPTLLLFGVVVQWFGYGVWLGLIAGFGTTAVLLARKLQRRLAEVRDSTLVT